MIFIMHHISCQSDYNILLIQFYNCGFEHFQIIGVEKILIFQISLKLSDAFTKVFFNFIKLSFKYWKYLHLSLHWYSMSFHKLQLQIAANTLQCFDFFALH